jgi:hypothetical protein
MKKTLILSLAFTILITSSLHLQPKQIISIIPKPIKIEAAKGAFNFSTKTKIWISEPTDELQKLGEILYY